MKKIVPFLWFNDKAEQAANFYVSIFNNSYIKTMSHYGEGGMGKKGSVMTVEFVLNGEEFIALNGGPMFTFNESISFVVNCETQQEVDRLWDALCVGGNPSRCGWLKDKYGLSWQIVPTALAKWMTDKNPEKARRVTEAMLAMGKLDIKKLKKAYDQK